MKNKKFISVNNEALQTKCFSTSCTYSFKELTNEVQAIDSNKHNFYEWFSGLADGESSFNISHRKPFSFVFSFEITLHYDDQDMLYFIQKELNLGKVNFSDVSRYTNKNKRGSFTITIKSGHNFFN